ncbi:MAG: hypothetical protein J6X28_01685 [Bacilli bacterium]|nr:hypothetical protein [Bacilli bacterium]
MAKNSNQKQIEKLVHDLDTYTLKLEKALASYKESLDAIQEGDGSFPYWNGSNACATLKAAVSQYQNSMNLLQNIKSCQASMKR